MEWIKLSSIEQADKLIKSSANQPLFFFKHSTRCSISSSALSRVERQWTTKWSERVTPVYLDLLAHRDVSQYLAEKLEVVHESPQLLLIKDQKCIFNSSHIAISLNDLEDYLH